MLQKSASIIRHHESWNMNSSVKIIDDCFQSNEIYYYFALKVMTRKILQYIEDDSRLFLLVHFPQSFFQSMSTAIETRPATMFTLFFWWIDCDAEISLDEVMAQVDHEKLRKCNFVMFCWPKKVFLVCTYTVYSTDSTMLRFQMRILMAKLNIKATYDNFPPPSIYLPSF